MNATKPDPKDPRVRLYACAARRGQCVVCGAPAICRAYDKDLGGMVGDECLQDVVHAQEILNIYVVPVHWEPK